MLVLSLFPGIGLLDMAFELEGFTVVRGPDVLWGGDIRAFHPPAGKFDGVIGGPPCQSFSSLAHLVRASGREPRFGNLIPEFERCVGESRPAWFLMENVPAAPLPAVEGYGVTPFVLDNALVLGDDGFGQEQMRLRRFCFGVLGRDAPNLLNWIDIAVFMLPEATGAATQWTPDNSKEAKCRTRTVTALGPDHLQGLADSTKRTRHEAVTGGHDKPPSQRVRRKPVLSNAQEVPVAIGGSGKVKASRKPPVTAMQGGESKRPGTDRVYARRYKLTDACRLQGLPEDFLADAPFTAKGKLKAVANGVPLPMGRAVAKAIKSALQEAT